MKEPAESLIKDLRCLNVELIDIHESINLRIERLEEKIKELQNVRVRATA